MHYLHVLARLFLALLPLFFLSTPLFGSYAFYVGRNLTADGGVLIGGTGEEVSSHWLEIVPSQRHPEGARIRIGVTSEANYPGLLGWIPQVRQTAAYITMNYTDFRGFPPPLTNGGLNEHGVAIRDVWSPSRDELRHMTPNPQEGVTYSDLARIALERATTARQAVDIMGELIERHGYATYGGNSHLIADAEEGWVVIQFAGGQGLWVAERLGPDDIRVLYPGYIDEVPEDFERNPNYAGAPHLFEFAIQQGWYDPSQGSPFSVRHVYLAAGRETEFAGDKYIGPLEIEQELRDNVPVTLERFKGFVRDPRWCDDEAGYGQVALLRPEIPSDLHLLWVAPTGAITAPFIPVFIGTTEVLPEYAAHRYLTKDAGRTFLDPDFQAQEATLFAGRLFKRLMYHTLEYPYRFLDELTKTLTVFERRIADEIPRVEETARTLIDAGRRDLAREYLTLYSTTKAQAALELGKALVEGTEARVRALYGIRRPTGTSMNTTHPDTVSARLWQYYGPESVRDPSHTRTPGPVYGSQTNEGNRPRSR